MLETVTALDIGSRYIKAITVHRGLKSFKIKSCKIFERYADESLEQCIKKVIDAGQPDNLHLIITYPQEDVIIRLLQFPFSDEKKIAQVIPYEAEEQLPFSISKLHYAFTVLESIDGKTEVLMAAVPDDTMSELCDSQELSCAPDFVGLESISLFMAYRDMAMISQELALQLDLGNSKTIMNLIDNGKLCYARTLQKSLDDLYTKAADLLKKSKDDIRQIFETLSIDFTDLKNINQKSIQESTGLTQSKLNKLQKALEIYIEDLAKEISISIKAAGAGHSLESINRILISGGGSLIVGLSSILSGILELPVIHHPAHEDMHDFRNKSLTPIAYGTVLSYFDKHKRALNLSPVRRPAFGFSFDLKEYSLPIFFLGLTLILFLINNAVYIYKIHDLKSSHQEIMRKYFREYFKKESGQKDVISEAKKILAEEQKKMKTLGVFIPDEYSLLETLKSITENFPADNNFKMKSIVINTNLVTIDATASSGSIVEQFRKGLINTKKYESVTLNIKKSASDVTDFSMTAKIKTETRKESEPQ